MTSRGKSESSSMTGLDRCDHNTMESPGSSNGLFDLDPGTSAKPGKYSLSGKRSSADGFYQSHESPRSASSSRPCSRPQSRHGSLPGSRMASRTNSQESIIDLFDNILTLNGKFVSPKPKPFKEAKLHWRDKVRMNHAIWRAWHIQYIKKKRPVICQFTAPEPDERARLQADIIQGGNANLPHPSNLGMHIQHYKNWRLYHKDVIKCSSVKKDDPEEDAIDLDKSHPPLSPMLAKNLANDDTLKDFSDTLFISKKKKFAAPTAKEIIRKAHISDIIQPSLMTLEPDLDEDFFMDTLESLTDLLTKTPTKDGGISSMSLGNNLDDALMSDSGHLSSSEYGGIMSTSSSYPIIVQSSSKPRTVSFDDIPAHTSRQLFTGNEPQMQYSPMLIPQTSQMGHSNFEEDMGVAADFFDLLNSFTTTADYSFQSVQPGTATPIQVMAPFGTESQMINTNTKMEPLSPIMHQCSSHVSSTVSSPRNHENTITGQAREKMLPPMDTSTWPKPPASSASGWNLQTNTIGMVTQPANRMVSAPVPMSVQISETTSQNFYQPQEQMNCDNSGGVYGYNQSLQIANRRDRMKGVSPHQSRTLAPLHEAVGSALSGKLDSKDRGIQSPTSEREALTPVLTPGYLSTASSTASSPGGPNEGSAPVEFEFQAPKSKKKRSELETKQKEQRRRIQHLSSEHKRRNNIHSGLDEIQRIVCGPQSSNDKTSQAILLQKTSEHIKSLQNEIAMKVAEMKQLNDEISSLNDQINEVQDELPDTGAPVSTQNDHQLQAMFDQYIRESMTSNWKFWIFRMLIEPLFASYLSAMSSVSSYSFENALHEWVDQSCRLRNLRPLATKAVREVSKKTTILSRPQMLPEQVQALVEVEASSQMES
ncbi:carbohydrate-responsive element-binding protein-like [Anneissia japonica]|uniref:carbohydrate-responsive element-binding protein-like n=1 Tax=Anneissia japonica TaxID=1529436 RepID=UPI0014257313|nr:carbohydrate-responsive element-binding protein-like [Anneissia japonica]